MVDQARPIVGRRSFAKHDADPLGTGIDDPLNIGTAKRGAIFVAAEFCDHHIGDLVDQVVRNFRLLVIMLSVSVDFITF